MTTETLVPFDTALERYEPLIGLETHVELGTRTKMFCGCITTFGAEPNTHVCPVCLGLPGSLPVVNRAAIEYAIRIGLALNCTIATWCRFARKNYFYPDMPKNFQISQYDEPLCTDGYLDVTVDGTPVTVGIERAHLEEDTGKSLHVGGATGRIPGAEYSLVDYNRAVIPLVEIVTKPIEGTGAAAPEVARAYVTELRDLVRALGVSDVRMEEGSLRSDVNTSLSPRGSGVWGTRTETKNVNSLRSVERAVRFEIERQAAVLDAGGRIIQETRHFHEDSGSTTSGRSKEEAQDYRYFPEPDLVPVAPDPAWVTEIGKTLPELPSARRARLPGGCPQVVARRVGQEGQRRGGRRLRAADHARAGGPGGRAGRLGRAQRQARPPGHRRRARRRGHPRRGGGRSRPVDRQRRLVPAGRHRRGHRRQRGGGRQDPQRQGHGGRGAGRRGHEDDRRQGRRTPGARADPGTAGVRVLPGLVFRGRAV